MSDEYRRELESCIEYARSAMPERIKALIGLASYDLWYGPIMWNAETLEEECEGEFFPFESACREIADWMEDNVSWLEDNVSDVRVESWYCEATDHSEYEEVDGSRREIIAALCGKELAKYI